MLSALMGSEVLKFSVLSDEENIFVPIVGITIVETELFIITISLRRPSQSSSRPCILICYLRKKIVVISINPS